MFNRNLSLRDLPDEICLSSIIRKDRVIVPRDNTELHIEDELLFFTKSEDIHKAEELF